MMRTERQTSTARARFADVVATAQRALLLAAPLVATLAAGSACTRQPLPDGVVVFASGTDLESGNPLVTLHPLSRQMQRFVLFTTLARYDSLLAPAPYLARSWSWSADRRALTFDLAADVRWHDGPATTARDAAFTLLAARDPATGYPRAGDLAALDTVTTAGEHQLTLHFRTPQPGFPLVLCELPIAPAHLLASIPRSELRRAAFNLNPVGNGPFRFVERIPGQRWVFERNDAFSATLGGPPNLSRLVIAVVDEPTTKFAGLSAGDLDFAGIAPAMASLAERDPTMDARDYPILFSTALVLNTQRPPFDDVRVRRALDFAINRERIVSAALAGYGRPAAGPVVPESPLSLDRGTRHDPAAADSLLDAAGWRRTGTAPNAPRERNGTRFAIELVTVGSGDNAIEQLIQADLAERGIAVNIRIMEFGSFLTRARARPVAFDVLLTGVSGDVSLAYLAAMYDSRQRGGVLDYADFHTPRLDSLFARARAAPLSAAPEAWRDVQRELAREMPAVWIYHARGLQGVSRRMQGVTFDLRGELASLHQWSASAPCC